MLRAHIVIRRIRQHVIVVFLLFRISPLIEFIAGQRNAFIQHGGNHIHKRNCRDDASVVLRRHVGHRADQQSAGTAARGKCLVLGCVLECNQMLRDIDEVRERVFFIEQPAVFEPRPTEFLTTPHVGNRHHESAIEKTDPAGAKHRIGRGPIGSVAILIQRRRPIERRVFSHHQRYRNLLAVPRRNPEEFRAVVRCVKSPQHRLGLFELLFVGPHIVVIGRARGLQRAEHVPYGRTIESRGVHQRCGVTRLIGCNKHVLARPPSLHPHLEQAA